MLTRRGFELCAFAILIMPHGGEADAQDEGNATVSIRADEQVRNILRPMEQRDLSIQLDRSEAAKRLAAHTPPGRAVPIILIIVGAIALIRILEMIKELYRQAYYGGVLIDTRAKPPLITNDLKIPADMVFVIAKDGATTQYKGESFDVSMLKSALSGK